MFEGKQQPIKAKQGGKGGRKHTLAPISVNESGQVRFHFVCSRPECGCDGHYTLEELTQAVELFKKEREGKGNGNRKQQAA